MRGTIRKIYSINTGWWDNFTSCFVGTLLGIVLTFGVSGYISRKEHRENEKTMKTIAVAKIRENISEIKLHASDMKRIDSLADRILVYYPDSIEQIPTSLIMSCMKELVTTRGIIYDYSVSNIMLGNSDIWTSMSPATVNVLNKTVFLTEHAMEMIYKVNDKKERILNNIAEDNFLYALHSPQEISHALFRKPENAYLLSRITDIVKYTNSILPVCDSVLKQLKNNMGITEDDLLMLKDKRYKSVKMLEDGVVSF